MGLKFNDVIPFSNVNYDFTEGKFTSIICSFDSFNFDYEFVSGHSNRSVSYVVYPFSYLFSYDTVRDELIATLKRYDYKLDIIDKRIEDALKIVNMDKLYLDRRISSLSSSEIMLISLVKGLILNSKVIVLVNVMTDLDNERSNYLIKLLKKLSTRYGKTIIFISGSFINLSDEYLLFKNNKLISFGKTKELVNCYDKIKSSSVETPCILKFISDVNKKYGINLDYTFDIKELMKDVYRNVK